MTVFDETRESVGPAREADRGALLDSLANAFFDDPFSVWNCPRDDLREDFLRRFFGVAFDIGLPHDEIWTDADRNGAAIWLPPGQTPFGPGAGMAMLRTLLTRRLFPRLPSAIVAGTRIEARHPRDPHWYLFVLGVASAGQGRGLGSQLQAPILERCDQDQVGAYLETSKESNIAFYARHGFRVRDQVRLRRGPSVYCMWRDPR